MGVPSIRLHVVGAGAVIHTHSKVAVLATLLSPGKEFRITHQEMIKGIRKCQSDRNYRYVYNLLCLINVLHDSSAMSCRYDEELVVPIIENTPQERDLKVRCTCCD